MNADKITNRAAAIATAAQAHSVPPPVAPAMALVLAIAVALGLTIIGAGGCGRDATLKLGVDIPADEPVVRLATVMENPDAYDGRKVVMQGIVSGQCAALCEFFMLDGGDTATIYPQGFKFPKLERGRNVTIYAQITSGEGQVVVSAVGLRM